MMSAHDVPETVNISFELTLADRQALAWFKNTHHTYNNPQPATLIGTIFQLALLKPKELSESVSSLLKYQKAEGFTHHQQILAARIAGVLEYQPRKRTRRAA